MGKGVGRGFSNAILPGRGGGGCDVNDYILFSKCQFSFIQYIVMFL